MKKHYELVEVKWWHRLKGQVMSNLILDDFDNRGSCYFVSEDFEKEISYDEAIKDEPEATKFSVFAQDMLHIQVTPIGNAHSVLEDELWHGGIWFLTENFRAKKEIMRLIQDSKNLDATISMGQVVLVYQVICDEFYTDEGWPEFEYNYLCEGVFDENVQPSVKD